jgi:hypothetical protein
MCAASKRCGGPAIIERIDADHGMIPDDIAERGAAYDARNRGKGVHCLHAFFP